MMNAKFYQVGGSVRDRILGLKSKDIDFSVECESYEHMIQAIKKRGYDIKVEKPEFLTVRAVIPGQGGYDFVMCRKEGEYLDGRRPESCTPSTIFDDLNRRDFTMNAIAIDANGEYTDWEGQFIDPHNGIGDIERKLIRTVGKAWDRFREDRLRILRAIRFHITKSFELDAEIIQLIINEPSYGYFEGISVERVVDELDKCFRYDTLKTLKTLEHFCIFRNALFKKYSNLKLQSTLKNI